MVMATPARSTVTGWVMVEVVPALLVPLTVIFTIPAGQLLTSTAGTPRLHVPSANTVAP